MCDCVLQRMIGGTEVAVQLCADCEINTERDDSFAARTRRLIAARAKAPRSARRRRVGRPRVAGDAKRRSVARLVAAEAAPHRRHARDLGHGVKLTDIAVARCALRPGLQMLAMRPSNAGSDLVHPHPWNGLPGFGKLRELHDCGLIFGNGGVAGHASPRCRKRHQGSGIGIGVAHLALQSQRQVRLVAVGNRLLGRGMRPKIVEHLLPRRRRSLLGLRDPSREKQRGNAYPRAPNYSAVFHQATSPRARLVPPRYARELDREPAQY